MMSWEDCIQRVMLLFPLPCLCHSKCDRFIPDSFLAPTQIIPLPFMLINAFCHLLTFRKTLLR